MPTIKDTTDLPARLGRPLVSEENTGFALQSAAIGNLLKELSSVHVATQMIHFFAQCSDATGGYVQFKPEHQFFPVLIGNGDAATPLYEFVEVLDEVLDYDLILNELPALSYSHIGGALAFLRKLTLTNPRNIDLDEIEDMAIASNPELLQKLRTAFADKESSRVLNRG